LKKKKINIAVITLALSSLIFSCNNNTGNEKIIARVHDNVLYLEEIKDIIPNNASKEDSTYIAQSYIDSWIQTQLYLFNAKKNISDEKLDFEREIQEYENSLIIHTYQQEIVKEKYKNFEISDKEIQAYYNSHKEEYTSNENYYQLRYFIGPESSLEKSELRALIKREDKNSDYETYCLRYAIDYYTDNNQWITIQEIIYVFPDEMQENLKNANQKQIIEYTDSTNYYAVMIFNIQKENELKEYDIVKEEIRETIIFEKKIQFIKDFEKEMFSEAENKGDIEIFTQ
jgi:PPIC-type PPIASE domain